MKPDRARARLKRDRRTAAKSSAELQAPDDTEGVSRKYEDMHVLDALNITQAEVMENGIVKRIVLGLGRRPSS